MAAGFAATTFVQFILAALTALCFHVALGVESVTTRVLIMTVAALTVWVQWQYRKCHHWENHGVPGPIPLPFLGTHLEDFSHLFQNVEERRYNTYGSIYGTFDGSAPGLTIGDPRLVEQVMKGRLGALFQDRRAVTTTHPVMSKFLSSLEGKQWHRVRKLVVHAFSPKKLKVVLPIMTEMANKITDTVREKQAALLAAARDDDDDAASTEPVVEVDLKQLTGDFTMEVISRAFFASAPTPEFVGHASSLFTFPYWRKFIGDYALPKWLLDPLGFTVLPKPAMDFFRSVTLRLIHERTTTNQRVNDGLQLLLDAGDKHIQWECPAGESAQGSQAREPDKEADVDLQADSTFGQEEDFDDMNDFNDDFNDDFDDDDDDDDDRNTGRGRQQLSEDEILAQAVLFYSVGYETASQLLLYVLYLLTTHPECQERLYKELLSTLPDGPKTGDNTPSPEVDVDKVARCEYLDAVINEALRLYNPVLRMERRAGADVTLDVSAELLPAHPDAKSGAKVVKLKIEKGTIISIPVWALHHDDKLYEAPFKFCPDRFLGKDKRTRIIQSSTYLPFGQGRRDCIGKRFALLESKVLIAKLVLAFRFVPTQRTAEPTFFRTGRPLLGPNSVFAGVQPRI